MKRLISISALCLASLGAAQGMEFDFSGYRASVGAATFSGVDGASPVIGLSGGISFEAQVGNLEFLPEILISLKGANIKRTSTYTGVETIVVTQEEVNTLVYLEMPFLLRFAHQDYYAFGGPSLGYLLSGAYDLSVSETIDGVPQTPTGSSGSISGINSFDLALVGGGGMWVGPYTVEARLSISLLSIDSSNQVRNTSLSVMVGRLF